MKMFSSKVIKIKDEETGAVKTFALEEFPENKPPSDAPASKRTVPKTKNAARLEAERIKIQAQQQATTIMEKASKDAQQIEQEAYRKGLAAGESSARQKIEQEFGESIALLRRVAAEFDTVKAAFYEDHQDIIIDLALNIARKVIHQEVTANRDLVSGVLRAAIQLTMNRERLSVRVNPADLASCIKSRPAIIRDIDGIKQLVFEPDESVGRGGALIEYGFGEIDARLEQQFIEIARSLHEGLAENE